MVYNAQVKVNELFDDYSTIASEVKRKIIPGGGIKILTPKKILRRLPTAIAEIKAGNTCENLLHKIRQIIYSSYQTNTTNKKINNDILNSIQIQYKMDTIFMKYYIQGIVKLLILIDKYLILQIN